jgi:DNA-binding XRE family transcriptional regulator
MVKNIENETINQYKSKLKKARVTTGMTQMELANLSGVNVKSISSYEQFPEKINKASIETILKLCDSLGCELDDIIERELIKK